MLRHLKSLIVFLCIFSVFPANADVIWPSMYVTAGVRSLWSIIGGLIAEILIVKYFFKVSWIKTIVICIPMNLASVVVGSAIIFIGGLGVEMLLYPIDAIFGIGSFHWSHALAAYIFAIFVNTLIESIIMRLLMKNIKYKRIFWCLFGANAISIMIAAVYVRVANVHVG